MRKVRAPPPSSQALGMLMARGAATEAWAAGLERLTRVKQNTSTLLSGQRLRYMWTTGCQKLRYVVYIGRYLKIMYVNDNARMDCETHCVCTT